MTHRQNAVDLLTHYLRKAVGTWGHDNDLEVQELVDSLIEATKEARQVMKDQPTQEQLKALREFASRNGRNWKSALNAKWMNGAYDWDVDDSASLQQIRNNLGPSWLITYKLPKGGR